MTVAGKFNVFVKKLRIFSYFVFEVYSGENFVVGVIRDLNYYLAVYYSNYDFDH